MKKILFFVSVVLMCNTVSADGYNSIVFRQADGTKIVLPAMSMKITFTDSDIIAAANNGTSTSMILGTIDAMYFSNDDNSVASINAPIITDDENVDVYNTIGVKVASGISISELQDKLAHGLYIVKTNSKTYKIQVK